MLGKSFWLIFDAAIRLVEFIFSRHPQNRLTKKNGNGQKTPDASDGNREPLNPD